MHFLKRSVSAKHYISVLFQLITNDIFAFLGVGLIKRKLANTSYPTLDITKDENDYISIKTSAPFRTQTTRFKIGEEFDEERMDGKIVKVCILSINKKSLLFFI